MAVAGIHVIHVDAVAQPALFIHGSVRVHKIGFPVILHKSELHPVVLVIIAVPSPVHKSVGHDQVGIILELIVQIHPAVDSGNRAAAGKLPERRIGVFAHIVILGDPLVVRSRRDLPGHPVFAGIDHRVVPCALHGAAESHGKGSQLLRRHVLMYGIFQIVYHGIAHRIRLQRRNGELRLRNGPFHGSGIRVNISAHFQSGRIGARHIRRIVRIQAALCAADLNKGKRITRIFHGTPVHRPLIFGNVDPLCNRRRFSADRRRRESAGCHCRRQQKSHYSFPQFLHAFLPVSTPYAPGRPFVLPSKEGGFLLPFSGNFPVKKQVPEFYSGPVFIS